MIGDKIIYLLPFIVCGIVRNNLDMRFILSCLVYLWIVSILDLFLPQLDSLPNPQPTYLNSTIIDPHVLDSLPKPPPPYSNATIVDPNVFLNSSTPPSSLPPPPLPWPIFLHKVWGFICAFVYYTGKVGENLHYVVEYLKKIVKWIRDAEDIRKFVINTPWLMNFAAAAWGFIMNRRRIVWLVFLVFLLLLPSVIFHGVFVHGSRFKF